MRSNLVRAPRFSQLSRVQWSAICLLLCCQSLMILDTSGLNVALVSIGQDLSVPVDQTGGINLGFVVALAATIPFAGWLGERLGTVRVLVTSLIVVVFGSLICASAISLPMIVGGRIVQGVGSSGLIPLASSLLFRNFAPEQRLRVMAALSLPIAIAPALGPFIGGLLVETLSWRWVFLLNLPLSLIAITVGIFFAREVQNRAARPLDFVGALLTLVGFGASVFGVERLATGNDMLFGAITLAIGVVALILLIPLEVRKGERAFLNVALFRRPIFAKATTITAAHSVGFMGLSLAGPLLLQTHLGINAFEAGTIGVVGALGPILSGRVARLLVTHAGPRTTIALSQSGILVGLGLIILGYVGPKIWLILVGVFLCGASSLLTIIACQTVGFAAVPNTDLGDATALDGSSRQIGNAFGIAAVSAALSLAATFTFSTIMTVAITLGVLAIFHIFALAVLFNSVRMHMPTNSETVK
jgi:EmrB/QacA subfamily drug resistance transporter